MKWVLLVATLLMAPVANSALAQPAPQGVDRAVETCLRANAARVSTLASSLTDAADFLLNNVCAAEVSAAAVRVQQERFERMRALMCDNNRPTATALRSDPGDDEDTAAYLTAYCANESDGLAQFATEWTAGTTAGPDERALAGQLVLDARSRRRMHH